MLEQCNLRDSLVAGGERLDEWNGLETSWLLTHEAQGKADAPLLQPLPFLGCLSESQVTSPGGTFGQHGRGGSIEVLWTAGLVCLVLADLPPALLI